MIKTPNITSNNKNDMQFYFFYSTHVSKGTHISIQMHTYLVPTGLKIDRYVLPLFVPFCENGPYIHMLLVQVVALRV